MRNKRLTRGLLIVPTLLWAVACSDAVNDPGDVALDAQLSYDVAAYVADQTVDDIAMMTHETDAVFGGPLLGPPRGGGMGGFSFDGNLTVTRTVTFYNEADEDMGHYHPDSTAYIHIYFYLLGERSRTTDWVSVSTTVERERDMWVTGLVNTETERTWRGEGSSSRERSVVSDARGDRDYDMSSTSTVTDVVIPVPRTEDSWPLSGMIERIVHVEWVRGDESGSRDCTALITFNGTQFVPIVINGTEYTFDLATRKIVEDTSG